MIWDWLRFCTCGPALMLMNLDIYPKRGEEEKKAFRVGRAVWQTMQAFATITKTAQNSEDGADEMKDSGKPSHEMITDEAEASGDSDGEDDEGDNFEAIPDYGSSFGVQQVSAMLDTPAHQRAGRNKNIVIVGSQLSKLTYSFTRRRVQDDW